MRKFCVRATLDTIFDEPTYGTGIQCSQWLTVNKPRKPVALSLIVHVVTTTKRETIASANVFIKPAVKANLSDSAINFIARCAAHSTHSFDELAAAYKRMQQRSRDYLAQERN